MSAETARANPTSEASAEEWQIPRPTPEELPAVLEALLFAATAPLGMKRLELLTGGTSAEEITAGLADLRTRYESRLSGLAIMEVAGGYQLATRPEVADWVLGLHKHRRKNPLTPALMETLAIVAYKQPIVRSEVEAIRGVDCGGVMRTLLESGLIDVVGQREVPGRPSLYGTTELFLKTFGLRELSDLPSLSEFKQIMESSTAPEPEPAAEESEADAGDSPEAESDSADSAGPEESSEADIKNDE
jgi:segregation and condensation protein B